MAISGIGLQSNLQFPSRNSNQRAANNAGSGNQIVKDNNNSSKNEKLSSSVASSVGGSSESTNTKTPLFAPVSQSANTIKSDTSRKNLVEVETARNRFKLQSDNQDKSKLGKSVQSFVDVANFERKDELQEIVGIDIFI